MTTLNEQMKNDLCKAARSAAENAYAPYSGFRVGAAIMGKSGTVYTGCNVENASFGLTICAERNACTTMVARGETEISAAAIFAGATAAESAPCGACRQVLLEFCKVPEVPILLCGADGSRIETSIGELCPYPFREFTPV